MSLELPSASVEVEDGGLGIVSTPSEDIHVVMGCAADGPTNLQPYEVATLERLKSDYKAGLATRAAAYVIGKTAARVVLVRLPASPRAAQVKDFVKPDGTTPTLTGTPNDGYDIVVECTVDGAPGTTGASFKWSKDGGETFTTVALAAATPGTHTGTTDTTTGGLYGGGGTLDGKKFAYTALPGGSPITVTLTAPTNAADLVSQINAQLSATIASIVANRLKLTSVATGATGGFTIAAGSPDALAVLGLTPGTYNGANGATTIPLTGTGLTVNFTLGEAYTAGEQITAWTIPAAASTGPVTATRAGSSTSVVTLSGSPEDDYEILYEQVKGCTVGTTGGSYRYSLDGGRSFSKTAALGTANSVELLDGTVSSGVTVNLGAGTLDATDKFAANAFGPDWATADALTAIGHLEASKLSWRFAHFVGWQSVSNIGSVGSKMQDIAAGDSVMHRFAIFNARPRGTYEKESNWESRLEADVANFENDRVGITAGRSWVTCPMTGRELRRSAAFSTVARLVSKTRQVDPGRRLDGSLGSDVRLHDDNGQRVEHDARMSPVLHAARYLTLRTYARRNGVFVTRGNLMAEEDSDFNRIAYRTVMDLAAEVFHDAMEEQLENHFATNPAVGAPQGATPGTLREADARRLDREISFAINVAVIERGYAVAVQARVSRTDPFLSTGELTAEVSISPFGYLDKFTGKIKFVSAKLAGFQTA